MNRDRIEGNWKLFKRNVTLQWGKLSGNHVGIIVGKHKRQAGTSQESYGISRSREEAEKRLAAWQGRQKN